MDRSPSELQDPDVVSRSANSSKFFVEFGHKTIFFLLKDSKQAASNYAAGLKMAR
jgi:hypothetical protein